MKPSVNMAKSVLIAVALALLCNSVQSKVDGSWSLWSGWSGWAKGLCSGNQRVRTKTCTNPMPSTDGEYCGGDNAENEPGSVDGGWGEWSQWSTCGRPCGGSVVNRTRSCNNPTPKHGGARCSGIPVESKLECLSKCPEGRVDGEYGEWTQWSPCLQTCSQNGGQTIRRSRQCNAPPPMNGGSACVGPSVERVMSCFNKCPRNGGFGDWSAWSECSQPCGTGTQTRNRLCNNPEPKGYGAADCKGRVDASRNCKLAECINAVNGSWSQWSSWDKCTSTYCMKGEHSRTRACNNPAPQNGGESCPGTARETAPCPSSNCIQYVPTLPLVSVVFPRSYMGRECGVSQKYRISTPTGHRVPLAVYRKLAFKQQNFEDGYFNFKLENGGKEIRYCFEPEPAITIKDIADNLIDSYRKTKSIKGYEKPADENRPITGFSVRVKNTAPYDVLEYDFGIELMDYFSPGQNMEIRNVSITYNTNGAKSSIMAKGEYFRFSPTIFKSKIFRYKPFTSMTGEAAKMTINHVFNFLGIRSIPSFIEKALRAIKVWNFEFGPCSIGYDFLDGWLESLTPFRFTATKFVDGIPLHLEIIASLKGTRWLFAIGFAFDHESFGAAMGKISGKKLADGGFFDNVGVNVAVGVMLNPLAEFTVSGSSTSFRKKPLDFFSGAVPKGFVALAQVSLPKDCGGSSFCRVTKRILGPNVLFRIVAHMPELDSIDITAGFRDIRITDTVSFSRLELLINYNRTEKTTQLGFRAEVKFPVKSGEIYKDGFKQESYLKIGGQITHRLGTTDVVGQLYMNGMWRKAFGVKWLAIGNINLGVTISADSPIGLSGLQLGGELEFGANCIYEADYDIDGHCIKVSIYFGIGKPNTYFYGEVSALTIGKLIRMFGGDTGAVPKPVADTGFPKGAMISYNAGTSPVNLAIAGGPYIYVGFRVKGTLNLFGWKIRVDIRLGDQEIYIDGECDPIKLGGVVLIARNNTHKDLGPKLFFQYRPKEASFIRLPFFKMYFEGYGNFFGIETYAYINITMSAMEIYVWGRAWNLVYAELYISASYGITDLKNAHFYVRVIVDMRPLTAAIKKAREAVDKALKAAQATLNEKIQDVKRAKADCIEKLKLKCSNCYALKCKEAEDNCKGFLNKAGKWIGGAINAAGKWVKNTAKKIGDGLAKVGKSIKKFFSGWRRRRSLISRRNENFDLHVRNRRFISKLICEGLVGGGCKGVAHLCYGSCKAVNFVTKGLCSTLDIAVGALKLAEMAVGWVNAAVQFILQMFLVHGIRFELGLGHKFGGGFMVAAEIDLTLFGNRMHFGFKFSLDDPVASIISAKDTGMYNYKQGVRQARTSVNSLDPYDPPNPFSDFDLSGTFGIESSLTGDELRLGSCLAVADKNKNSRLILKGCNDTDAKQQWSFTLKGSLINLHSKNCIDLSDATGEFVVQKECKDNQNSQKYECDVVTRSLKRRRSTKCVTVAGQSSPNGPGSLTHLGSLKCIGVDSRNSLILQSQCQTDATEWKLDDNGYLKNMYHTRYCVRAAGGTARAGATLQIVTSGCHKFSFTKKGSLMHNSTHLCIQTANKEMIPSDNTKLILGTSCNNVDANAISSSLPDPQMLFSFIPKNKYLKMQDCGDFDDLRMDQRFEVRNDELASICSKFAPDIALKKTAVQSSTSHNGFASRAVDGNFKFHWSDKTCTHTNDEQDPWWRVDLEKEYIVTDITIINRGEHGERLKNIQAHVGNQLSNHRLNPVCHDRVRFASDGEAVRLQCNPPIPGRYVAIQMYGKGILTMCEVIVASRMGGLADYCLLENGGCDQLCFNKCDKKTSCGCLPGYVLAYDKRTCLDINECKSNNGGCRRDKHAYCSNYPGGYYCACTPGYILKDNSLTECVDFNECGVNNGGCEQLCNNTNGGYLCECRAGFKRRTSSLFGCEDINECLADNGGCDHTCQNYDGGRYCSCRNGYRLATDGKTCEEIYCRALEKPERAIVSPKICTRRFANIPRGTNCLFNCTKGFEIKNGNTLKTVSCQTNGFWDKPAPSCNPVRCSGLTRPQDGGIVPPSCSTGNREFGQRCVVYCKYGYKLNGPATKYCQADKKWSNSAPNQCIKIVQTPYLNCPVDIQVSVQGDMTGVQLGARFPQPATNIPITSVSHKANHIFPVGMSVIKFEAVSEEGVKKTCHVIVDVRDVVPPKITNCPSDIIKKVTTRQAVVSWPKPSFYDAVGVTRIEEPYIPSGSLWTVGESALLQYRISDAAGNIAKCNFRVTVKSYTCPTLNGDQHASITEQTPNVRYQVSCAQGFVLFGPYSHYGEYAYCKDGDYEILGHKIGDTLPDCVKFLDSDATSECPRGAEKFEVDDWFGMKYYCYECPTGSFMNASNVCVKCPVGFYQDDGGMDECEPCPVTHSTKAKGATEQSDCIPKCKAGTFSPTGLDETMGSCNLCPKGTYNEIDGSTECTPCPKGTTSLVLGASDISQCVGPPKMSFVMPGLTITEQAGNALSIACLFKDIILPAPTTKWTKIGGSLPATATKKDVLNIDREVIGMILIIPGATAANSGSYKCEIQNQLGKDTRTFKVTVS